MDLSREKILFASSRPPLSIPLLLMSFSIVAGIWSSSLFDPHGTYYGMDSFLHLCAYAALFALLFLVYKILLVERFYIVEDGMIIRSGVSGKWYRLGFASIESVVHTIIPKVEKKPGYHSIVILCKNHMVLYLPGRYGDTNLYRAADVLKDRNLPLSTCTTREEMKHIAAGYTPKKAAEWQEASSPFLAALHYYVTFLPLFAVVCLCIAGVLNAHCGMQKNVVVRGTIAAVEAQHRHSKILVNSSQGELWFPVNSNLIGQLRIDEQLEAHYKEGCAGIDYGLAFKRIK